MVSVQQCTSLRLTTRSQGKQIPAMVLTDSCGVNIPTRADLVSNEMFLTSKLERNIHDL